MIARFCMVALTLGGSILTSQAGPISLTTSNGSRTELNCASDDSTRAVADLPRPLEDVITTLRQSLTRTADGEGFVLRDQSISPAKVAESLRVVYETRASTSGSGRVQVKAYVDLDLDISEARRTRLLDAAADRAGIPAEELERKIVFAGGECQIRR